MPAASEDIAAPSPTSAVVDADAKAMPSRTVAKPANPYAGIALPPAGLPANQIVDDLLRRAKAGDTRAACRLGAELIRCSILLGNVRNLTTTPVGERILEQMDKDEATLEKEHFDFASALLANVQTCTGVDAATVAQGPKWLRTAALAGENDALVLYADGMGMQPGAGSPYSFIRDPGFDAWRREAPGMMWQALRQGSPDAVFALNAAYSSDYSAFGALVEDDPARARVLSSLFRAVYGTTRRQGSGVSPSAQADADAQAAVLFAEHFHSRRLPPNRGYNVWSAVSPITGISGSAKHSACDDPSTAVDAGR
jgi:hypothetical protein